MPFAKDKRGRWPFRRFLAHSSQRAPDQPSGVSLIALACNNMPSVSLCAGCGSKGTSKWRLGMAPKRKSVVPDAKSSLPHTMQTAIFTAAFPVRSMNLAMHAATTCFGCVLKNSRSMSSVLLALSKPFGQHVCPSTFGVLAGAILVCTRIS